MRILCFSDLHCDQKAAAGIVSKAESENIDFVIGAGDFANQHHGIERTLDILKQIRQPTVLVPGNGETTEELISATSKWANSHVLHGSGITIGETDFFGVGGGIPVTPFGDWSFDFDETAAEQMLADCPSHSILVVHSPPLDTVDSDSSGRVRGSRAIRDCVLEKKPVLVVCGHIHSSWEQQMKLGSSLILNAGPRGVVVELN